MIRVGDNPDDHPTTNKFLTKDGEGHRGRVVALRVDGKEAIVESLTYRAGSLFLVRERSPLYWPTVVRPWTGELPLEDDRWKMIAMPKALVRRPSLFERLRGAVGRLLAT